jgi:hypothetical protein
MGQEDTEKEISFDCLRAIVDVAIKTKNICPIERITKENQLRYMQKYAESLISKTEFEIGKYGLGLAVVAIGLSYIIVATHFLNELIVYIGGIIIILLGCKIILSKTSDGKNIEFIHEIILKIEEKLANKTY